MTDIPAQASLSDKRTKTGYNIDLSRVKKHLNKFKRKMMARHLWLVRLVVLLGAVVVLLGALAVSFQAIRGTRLSEYGDMAGSFLFLPNDKVKTREDRTNIVLMGMSGGTPENPRLADSLIFMSINHESSRVDMISIPRDIWVPELHDKINSTYFHGNESGVGGGMLLTKSIVEEVVGQPVHYTLAIEFDGFVEVIDQLGGVTIDVERSFTDKRFPVPGREDDDCGDTLVEEEAPEFACRYETVSFEKGVQRMDGTTALKYARSRQSEDEVEGNDLARAARQQKVLVAMKDEVLKGSNLLFPRKILALWNTFWKITETDLDKSQMAYIVRLLYDSRNDITSHILPEEMLDNPPYSSDYDFLFVFLPAAGDWSQVHDWVDGVLAGD